MVKIAEGADRTDGRRRGRTPSLSPERIATAVHEVGQRGAISMQNVAAALSVDVTTLYRHVGGVEELRRMWATMVAPQMAAWPEPEGGSWERWLASVCRHYRRVLLANPDLIRFGQRAIDPRLENLDQVTRVLTRYGFAPRAAAFAHGFLVTTVIGFVVQELEVRAAAREGNRAQGRWTDTLATAGHEGRLQMLQQVVLEPRDFEGDTSFETFLDLAIGGIRASLPPRSRARSGRTAKKVPRRKS
jgi:AcrR family transcriptional regulator